MNNIKRRVRDLETGKTYLVDNMDYKEWHNRFVKGNPNAELAEKKLKNLGTDKKQHAEYRKVLGREVPKSIDAFQGLKYTDSKKWDDLKATNRYNKIVEESTNLHIKGIPIKDIDRMDISDYNFAEDHINSERNHKVTKVMAQEYINNKYYI